MKTNHFITIYSYGQLGGGDTIGRRSPTAIIQNVALAGKSVIQVNAGDGFSVILCSDGSIFTFGRNR